MQSEDREKGDTMDTQFSSSIWKQMRDTASSVQETPKFGIGLRVEGVFQDAILRDEEQMKAINETVEKLKIGSKSIGDMILNVNMTMGSNGRQERSTGAQQRRSLDPWWQKRREIPKWRSGGQKTTAVS